MGAFPAVHNTAPDTCDESHPGAVRTMTLCGLEAKVLNHTNPSNQCHGCPSHEGPQACPNINQNTDK